jgi:hypothetical protein
MDRLFSPCTRFYDMLESQGRLERFRGDAELLQELSLDVSTEELLTAERAFTYMDLYAMLGNENAVVWLTPHAAVMPVGGIGIQPWMLTDMSCRSCFNVDGKDLFVLAHSPEHLSEICDILLRILAASVVHSVRLYKRDSRHCLLINAPTLAHLMEKCQSLKNLTLADLEMDENHCRVLGTFSRPGLKIELICCQLTSAGTSALAEVLGRNQGPTKLFSCDMDGSVLANCLRGNSRLKYLRLPFLSDSLEEEKRQLLGIASALRENKGLVELNLSDCSRRDCDETWYAVCDSLKTHPTLEVLHLSPILRSPSTAPAVTLSRIQALLDMMKMNMSIHTIHLHYLYSQHELFWGSIIPYLETNRLRPRVRAIQKTRPIPYRAGVLGRALLAVRSRPNSFWMLLTGNAEVIFPSRTTTIAAAASLPTSATATAAAITSIAAGTADASFMSTLPNSATASLPTAAAPLAIRTTAHSTPGSDSAAAAPNDATPPTDQKRKARP